MNFRLFVVMTILALASCYNGDREWNQPRVNVEVTRKGCMLSSAKGSTNSLVINVNSEKLPDGRIRCTIETVTLPNNDK